MVETYPITEEQKALLGQFTCERLTANINNLFQIQRFRSYNGQGLVNNLLCNGWNADSEGSTAYYVVKNPKKQIVLFFSLRCGMLFDPDYVIEYMDKFKETFEDDKLVLTWQRYMEGDPEAAQFFIDKQRQMGDRYHDFKESLMIKVDKKNEPNKKIIRVGDSRPAIELVEFCANDATKGCWDEYDLGPRNEKGVLRHRMGETLFWWFVVPAMLEINKLIGCEYVYLFAADKDKDGRLSNYYRETLHFDNLLELGTVKPSYDFRCFFMGSRLRGPAQSIPLWGMQDDETDPEPRDDLEYYRKDFFDNFNDSTEDLI